MVDDPAATPVARPLLLTVAIDVDPLAHVTVRPVNVFPAESFSVAVSWTVFPTPILGVAGVTVTDATDAGGVTVTVVDPLTVPLVAVIVAEPTATPVTRPLLLTVAINVDPLAHVTVRPVNVFPAESFSVAVNWTVFPTPILGVPGVTVTVATGAGPVTVTVAVPLTLPLAAVMVDDPAATPVTSPLEFTLATNAEPLAHDTGRPVKVFPAESFSVAVSWTVFPTPILGVPGVTVTVATGAGALTVTLAEPLALPLVAVMVALPAATPVASPLEFTVATDAEPLAHDTGRPLKVFPAESFSVAVSWTVFPTPILGVPGVTVTDATGAGVVVTVTVAEPLTVPLVAVMVALPAATPVTSPLEFTLATGAEPLAHVTGRPLKVFPAESFSVAVSWTVFPTPILGLDGATVTEATDAVVTVMLAVSAGPSCACAAIEYCPGVAPA